MGACGAPYSIHCFIPSSISDVYPRASVSSGLLIFKLRLCGVLISITILSLEGSYNYGIEYLVGGFEVALSYPIFLELL